MIFTDNKLFHFQTDNCVIFIGIYGSQEPGDDNIVGLTAELSPSLAGPGKIYAAPG